ncbi:MAG: prolyl oligopeptidase family serine peptidase [Streptosporangiales bacterium]|nr:prolyl oligopeptidase family serine peptidase [Streptosporangiales bacterium]
MSDDRLIAPYGTWPSPISAEQVARSGLRLSSPRVIGGDVWWQETRPEERGRTTVVHRAEDGTRRELLSVPWNARTRVHEYGGRSYLPARQGDGYAVIFAHYDDQRLYRLDPGGKEPRPITPQPDEPTALRYADPICSPDGSEVWCVRESHAEGKVTRALVAVPLDGSAADDPAAVRQLVTGVDFFASPCVSPDGRHLAWISWNHPRMPWDGTELRVAKIEADGSVGKSLRLKGGPSESVQAPTWADDQRLYVVSDWSGWWNLYEVDIYAARPEQALYPSEEEFAGPPWLLGDAPYAVLGDGRIAVLHGQGEARLAIIDPETAELSEVDVPYTDWSYSVSASGTMLVGIAGSPTTPRSAVRVNLATGRVEALRREIDELPDSAYLPRPRAEEFSGPFGRPVYALVCPPSNPKAQAPEGELPPYVVFAHGGPTGHGTSLLDLEKAFFTSRGIGVLYVNYGGSTGYGRAYRERLRRQWGVVDVEDCVAAARALVDRGEADGERLAIRGGSAGGWTTLAALTGTDMFRAGTSYYGVSELLGFAEETHDFESRYLEGLVGTLPRDREVYVERAPLSHADKVDCPVLLLQGLDDPIVLPTQSEKFADALARNQVPHAYLAFEGEAHGFRRAETGVACLSAELSFYGQVFGFEPPGVPRLKLVRTRGEGVPASGATDGVSARTPSHGTPARP